MDATEPYLTFWSSIAETLSQQGISAAEFNVTYTLMPHATYPTQLCEALEALRYVIEDLGRSPEDIILLGDSAGANLCLAILSHLSHPGQEVPKLQIAKPLKALVCLSPWVSFRHEWPSMDYNKFKDIDEGEVTERWSREYLNGRPTNNYVEAVNAPESWWQDAQVEQTLVLAGGDEVLLDPIKAWVTSFRVCHSFVPSFLQTFPLIHCRNQIPTPRSSLVTMSAMSRHLYGHCLATAMKPNRVQR